MTPFSARLTFLGFVALAGAIATNALYLQQPLDKEARVTGSVTQTGAQVSGEPRRETLERAAPKGDLLASAQGEQPDPDTLTRSTVEPEAALRDDLRNRTPSLREMPRGEVVRAIQRELSYRNYSIAQPDGQLDLATRVAILNYQYDTGMALTGRPSEALLKQILFGPFQGAPESHRIDRLESDRALVAGIQRLLSQLGFGNVPENGRLGPETRRALREFAAFRDLRSDGRLTPRLLLEAADVTDKPLSHAALDPSKDFN